jgi:ABC-type transport system substrate-binding protein
MNRRSGDLDSSDQDQYFGRTNPDEDSYIDDALDRLQTRRGFLANAARTGGALALSTGALAGIPSMPAASAAVFQRPKRGGTITFGVGTNPFGFDPAKWWDGLPWCATEAVFDRLFRITDSLTLVPELLAGMPKVNRDHTLFTFKLRPGVKFHHGRELTADDVKFTLERIVSPATASEAQSLYSGLGIVGMQDVLNEKAKSLKGIKVTAKHAFTVQFETPDSVFLNLLGLPFAGIVPRDVVDQVGSKKFNIAPVGTGPFMMKDVNLSRGLSLERNGRYWIPGVPYVDRVVWKIGVDPSLSVLRIERGEQDLMYEQVPSGSLDGIRNDPKLSKQLVIASENLTWYMTMSLKHPALKKLKVRQAIAMAIDKEHLVRVEKGLGIPARGGMFSPLSPFYSDGLALPYNPQRAKALLKEAGYPDGFDVVVASRNYTPWKELGEVVQASLQAIGIRTKGKYLASAAYAAYISPNPAAITMNGYELPYAHGSYLMDPSFTSGAIKAGCCNFANYASRRFDQLAASAHQTFDMKKLVSKYRQMDRIVIHDDVLFVALYYPKHPELVSAQLRGYKVPRTPFASVKFFAKYWLA